MLRGKLESWLDFGEFPTQSLSLKSVMGTATRRVERHQKDAIFLSNQYQAGCQRLEN